ncbi:MAG: hydroxylamine reductase, partial [Desulfobacterales bacterium]|nr:hydroxylamine reductase [Desulfobacterales bacterium]MDX2511366.1 hydroxylamine reductase [Desulfobacterales bacterium]
MFCFQCEQTAKGQGCTNVGVCGKQPDTAALQDLLIYTLKGLSQVALKGHSLGLRDTDLDHFTCEAVFSTLTNVNFDSDRFVALIQETVTRRDALKKRVEAVESGAQFPEGPATFSPASNLEELVSQGESVGIQSDPDVNPDILSLRELLIYGLKGLAAYADHARILGQHDDTVYDFVYQALAATLDDELGVEDLVGLALKCGEVNLKAMELLDTANTGTYGHPVPTSVPLGVKKGKAILVSG